jgi:hypothetical protein
MKLSRAAGLCLLGAMIGCGSGGSGTPSTSRDSRGPFSASTTTGPFGITGPEGPFASGSASGPGPFAPGAEADPFAGSGEPGPFSGRSTQPCNDICARLGSLVCASEQTPQPNQGDQPGGTTGSRAVDECLSECLALVVLSPQTCSDALSALLTCAQGASIVCRGSGTKLVGCDAQSEALEACARQTSSVGPQPDQQGGGAAGGR